MTKKIRKRHYKGFTLAELLISSAIFIVVSGVILTALFSAFRLSKKSDTLLTIRQNGDAVMTQIVRGIKYARFLNDPETCVTPVTTDSITITSATDQGETTYSCPNDVDSSIASNGASLIDENQVQVITCTFTCTQTYYYSQPTIRVTFSLGTPTTDSGFTEGQSGVDFQTSVTMRNYTK